MYVPIHRSSVIFVAGAADDDWGAFEGDQAPAASTPQHSNGFAVPDWDSFQAAGLQPAAALNGLTASGAPGFARATAVTEDAGQHRRGVSTDKALPEGLFSEATPESAPAAVQEYSAAGPAGNNEDDDDFGDFADAEPVPSAPGSQPTSQLFVATHGPPQLQSHPPGLADGSAGGPGFAAAFPDDGPASTATQPAGLPGSSAVHLNGIAAGSQAGLVLVSPATVAMHTQQQDASAVAHGGDDGFADFGDFAEASHDDGSNFAAVQQQTAFQQKSPFTSPGKPATRSNGSAPRGSSAWSPVTAHAAVEAAGHQRGVSRCAPQVSDAPSADARPSVSYFIHIVRRLGWTIEPAYCNASPLTRWFCLARDQALPEDLFAEHTADAANASATQPAASPSKLVVGNLAAWKVRTSRHAH